MDIYIKNVLGNKSSCLLLHRLQNSHKAAHEFKRFKINVRVLLDVNGLMCGEIAIFKVLSKPQKNY